MVDTLDYTKQPSEPAFPPTLADLSRNASVISSSSDSESNPSEAILLKTPRPRPTRTFSSPRSRSPHSPTLQTVRPPPSYLTRELGVTDENRGVVPEPPSATQARSKSRKRSRSQNPSANTRLSAQDFVFGGTLGEGSYSTVMLARYARTGQEYAIKILDKNHLIRKEKMLVALAEKNTLVKLGAGHPGIIHLHWTFQDDWSLFFVLDLAKNGEMQTRISRMGSLSLACARYYTAQIVDAIEYMHDKDVIHRDLKPENLLLDSDFRVRITDFGTGKILENGQERANTFVGTAQYVSPELLERNETSKSSDLWSLGCIVYQMIAGRFAFQGLSEYLTWQKIKNLDYSFPEGFDADAKDFVEKLLVRDPLARLGASRTRASPTSPTSPTTSTPSQPKSQSPLRSHPFLASINWDTLWTDPAPPLEAGLVKKAEAKGGGLWGEEGRWEDVGTKWDELVGDAPLENDVEADDETRTEVGAGVSRGGTILGGDDGMRWAEDGQGTEFERYRLKSSPPFIRSARTIEEEVGPMGEVADYKFGVGEVGESTEEGGGADPEVTNPSNSHTNAAEAPNAEPTPAKDQSLTLPLIPQPSGTGSGTSSSDGSLVDKTGVVAALAAMELNRGRNRVLTPVQGNGPACDADWSSLLLPGETVLFNTRVEARSPKRRGSRLRLPISVSPIRPKTRQLLLTTHRLLCVKARVDGGVSLKSELSLRMGAERSGDKATVGKEKEKEKEKEAKSVVESAERKGEREFVVLTSTKSQTYAAESNTLSAQWVDRINASLSSPPPASTAPTTLPSKPKN